MVSKTDHIASSHCEYKLLCRYWEPAEAPRALIFISHGFAEHSLKYDDLAVSLRNSSFYVFSHDHVGHGQSEGNLQKVDSYKYFTDDVISHVGIICNRFKNVPVFGIGHSMGGAILTICEMLQPSTFSGLLLISPMFGIVSNPAVISIGKFVGSIFKDLPIPGVNSSFICKDKSVVEKYDNDPDVRRGSMSARIIMQLVNMTEFINKNVHNFKTPILCQHGTADKICKYEATVNFHEKIISSDKTLTAFPDSYHQLHNEPDGVNDKCMKEIQDWIDSRM